jgi:hypothetical protein
MSLMDISLIIAITEHYDDALDRGTIDEQEHQRAVSNLSELSLDQLERKLNYLVGQKEEKDVDEMFADEVGDTILEDDTINAEDYGVTFYDDEFE